MLSNNFKKLLLLIIYQAFDKQSGFQKNKNTEYGNKYLII